MAQILSALAAVAWALWFGGAVGLYLFVEELFAADHAAASRMIAPVFLLFGKYRLALAAAAVVGISCRRVAEGPSRMNGPMFFLLAVLVLLVPLGILIVVGVERTAAVNPRTQWIYLILSAIALLGLILWRLPQGGDRAGLWAHVVLTLCAMLAGVSVVAVSTSLEAARRQAMERRIRPADSDFARLHAISRGLAGAEAVLLLVGGVLLTWRGRPARREEPSALDIPIARMAGGQRLVAQEAGTDDAGDRKPPEPGPADAGEQTPSTEDGGSAEHAGEHALAEVTAAPPEGFTEDAADTSDAAQDEPPREDQPAGVATEDAPAEEPSASGDDGEQSDADQQSAAATPADDPQAGAQDATPDRQGEGDGGQAQT